jgi:LexA-binding, inner membrane-associated putative hydrolase
MLFEHLIYSTAIAILAGMVYYRFVGRDYSWIIIASAYAPDIDMIFNPLLRKMGISLMINGHPIAHGNFHNMAFLIVYSISVAFLLHPIGIRFTDSLIFAGLGFASALFEDALVFDPAYSFFWPITSREFGIGLFHYSADLYGIADSGILMVGLILIGFSAILRTAYEGTGWIRRMLPVNRIFCHITSR